MPLPELSEESPSSAEQRQREKRKWWTIRIPTRRGVHTYRCPTEEVAVRLLALFAEADATP